MFSRKTTYNSNFRGKKETTFLKRKKIYIYVLLESASSLSKRMKENGVYIKLTWYVYTCFEPDI